MAFLLANKVNRMRRIVVAALAALAAEAIQAAEPIVHNIAPAFATTWDASKDLPMPERVAAFRKNVASKFPEFYDVSRFGSGKSEADYDKYIARSIENFAAIRNGYLEKASVFGDALPRHLKTFDAVFPDFHLSTPIWLVHSLGEMDGGTRELKGKHYLIFGADMIERLHPEGDLAPLFHHELFHVYHEPRFACNTEAVWKNLWEEGLATYVSHAMNPKANQTELLLDFPKGMPAATEAKLAESWAQLEQVLDNTDPAMYAELFSTGKTASELPRRRGYYLGYLVAKEAAKTRTLGALANMDCKEARAQVVGTIRKLSKEGTQ